MTKSHISLGLLFVSLFIYSCSEKKKATVDFNKNYSFKALNSDELLINLISVRNKVTGLIFNPVSGSDVQISGFIIDDSLYLNEYDKSGNITVIYSGIISDSVIVGSWSKPDGSRKTNFIWKETSANKLYDINNLKAKVVIPEKIPPKFWGKYGSDCNAIDLEIIESNPINIMVNSNQISVLGNLVPSINDDSKLLIYLEKYSDLGRGGMSLDWDNFSTQKPIGSISIISTNPKTLKIEWIGFYNNSSGKYDWTESDFGSRSILKYCDDSPQQIKRELLEAEWQSPSQFLKVSGVYHKTFNKFSIDITVQNNATLATFKDVQVKIDYVSKTNTLLLSKNYMKYDFFYAGKSKTFSWNLADAPNGTQTIRLSFVSASPA